MSAESSGTTITDIELDPEYGFHNTAPLGVNILVTARSRIGEDTMFLVSTADGSYRPDLDCHILDYATGASIEGAAYPDVDFDVVINAANEFLDANLTLEDTGARTAQGNKLFLAINPVDVRLVEENWQYYDPQPLESIPRFSDDLWIGQTIDEARQYVDAHFRMNNETNMAPDSFI